MKKRFLIGAIVAVAFGIYVGVANAREIKEVTAKISPFNYTVDGHMYSTSDRQYVDKDGQLLPVSINYGGTQYVPLRLISEALGYGVMWDDPKKHAELIPLEATDHMEDGIPNVFPSFYDEVSQYSKSR